MPRHRPRRASRQRAERLAAGPHFLDERGYRRRAAPRACAGRRLDARLRAPLLDDQRDDPDECAAPAGRAAGARRQALQRDRASRRGRHAVRRDGAGLRDRGLSAPTILHADLTEGFVILEDLGDEGIVARRSAGADRGALSRPPSMCWRRCTASRCRRCCPSRRARLSPAALRHGRVPDRGRAAARLVPAAARRSP